MKIKLLSQINENIICSNPKLQKSTILKRLSYLGYIPYISYNTSILKLTNEEFKSIKNINIDENFNDDVIFILFFCKPHNHKWGSMNFLGILSYTTFINIFNKQNDESVIKWIIKPRLIQNVLGPKYADPRLFKINVKNKIYIYTIGYTRLSDKSNVKNMPDYYVRTSPINFEYFIDNYNGNNNYNFGYSNIGCFPHKILYSYEKFEHKNKQLIDNIEFFLEDNKNSEDVYPHFRKNNIIPNKLRLVGIEVSFSKNDSNENKLKHISRKNIIPLQNNNIFTNKVNGFIDFSSPISKIPEITIINLENKRVLYNSYLNILNIPELLNNDYRGSTPCICIGNFWITILHKRFLYKNKIKYKDIICIFSSKNIKINNSLTLDIPDKCLTYTEIKLSDKLNDYFIFTTGLIVNKINNVKSKILLDLIISFGIQDLYSSISSLNIEIIL